MVKRISLNFLVAAVLLAAAAVPQSTDARVYNVGDTLGWLTPPNSTTYSTWASTYSFTVGDILVFNFITGQHDVARVSVADFNSCAGSNPITPVMNSSPVNVTLNTTGGYYFMCTFSGHCSSGQKLAINVAASSGPTPSPPPPSTGTPAPPAPTSPTNGTSSPPPPSGSGALPLGTAAIFAVFMSIAVVFLC